MKSVTANEAKQNFGQLIDNALQGPVSVTKHGRPSVVVTSATEYGELISLKHEQLKKEVAAGFADFDEGRVSNKTVEDIFTEARENVQN